jgi:hypothetical protein
MLLEQAGLRDRCRYCMESIEPAGIWNELRPTSRRPSTGWHSRDPERAQVNLGGQARPGTSPGDESAADVASTFAADPLMAQAADFCGAAVGSYLGYTGRDANVGSKG